LLERSSIGSTASSLVRKIGTQIMNRNARVMWMIHDADTTEELERQSNVVEMRFLNEMLYHFSFMKVTSSVMQQPTSRTKSLVATVGGCVATTFVFANHHSSQILGHTRLGCSNTLGQFLVAILHLL
jgi:hypothetical protein